MKNKKKGSTKSARKRGCLGWLAAILLALFGVAGLFASIVLVSTLVSSVVYTYGSRWGLVTDFTSYAEENLLQTERLGVQQLKQNDLERKVDEHEKTLQNLQAELEALNGRSDGLAGNIERLLQENSVQEKHFRAIDLYLQDKLDLWRTGPEAQALSRILVYITGLDLNIQPCSEFNGEDHWVYLADYKNFDYCFNDLIGVNPNWGFDGNYVILIEVGYREKWSPTGSINEDHRYEVVLWQPPNGLPSEYWNGISPFRDDLILNGRVNNALGYQSFSQKLTIEGQVYNWVVDLWPINDEQARMVERNATSGVAFSTMSFKP